MEIHLLVKNIRIPQIEQIRQVHKISNNDLSKEIVGIYPLLLALKACLKTLKHNHKSLYKINANDRKIILSCLYKFMGLRRHDNMIKNECTLLIHKYLRKRKVIHYQEFIHSLHFTPLQRVNIVFAVVLMDYCS